MGRNNLTDFHPIQELFGGRHERGWEGVGGEKGLHFTRPREENITMSSAAPHPHPCACAGSNAIPRYGQVYLDCVILGGSAQASETRGFLDGGSGTKRWPAAAGEVTTHSGECPSDRPPGLPEVSSRHCWLGQGRWPYHHLWQGPWPGPRLAAPPTLGWGKRPCIRYGSLPGRTPFIRGITHTVPKALGQVVDPHV